MGISIGSVELASSRTLVFGHFFFVSLLGDGFLALGVHQSQGVLVHISKWAAREFVFC
jgi:hypothetical protein